LDVKEGDRFIIVLPFYHGYAFSILLLGIYADFMLILLPSFEPKLFLTLMQEFKVNYMPIVPPILTFLAKHPMVEKYDFSNVKEIICGAAPFAKEVSFLPSS
jgi:acyl-CoA synthetase (AMP-forming)/AMP-acid ligase II